MQHKIKLLNKEQDWSRLKNYRPNEVVNHNGKQWQNVTGLNSEPSDSSFDWVNIPDFKDAVSKDYVDSEIQRVENINFSGILGSVNPTTNVSALQDGVYRAEVSGLYQNLGGLVVKEGYSTLLRKDGSFWDIESEVKLDLGPIETKVDLLESTSEKLDVSKFDISLNPDGYFLGKTVLHNDKLWESLVSNNKETPSETSTKWREVKMSADGKVEKGNTEAVSGGVVTEYVKTNADVFDVSVLTNNYALTLDLAVLAVPQDLRKRGLKIKFNNNEEFQFLADYSEANWTKKHYWIRPTNTLLEGKWNLFNERMIYVGFAFDSSSVVSYHPENSCLIIPIHRFYDAENVEYNTIIRSDITLPSLGRYLLGEKLNGVAGNLPAKPIATAKFAVINISKNNGSETIGLENLPLIKDSISYLRPDLQITQGLKTSELNSKISPTAEEGKQLIFNDKGIFSQNSIFEVKPLYEGAYNAEYYIDKAEISFKRSPMYNEQTGKIRRVFVSYLSTQGMGRATIRVKVEDSVIAGVFEEYIISAFNKEGYPPYQNPFISNEYDWYRTGVTIPVEVQIRIRPKRLGIFSAITGGSNVSVEFLESFLKSQIEGYYQKESEVIYSYETSDEVYLSTNYNYTPPQSIASKLIVSNGRKSYKVMGELGLIHGQNVLIADKQTDIKDTKSINVFLDTVVQKGENFPALKMIRDKSAMRSTDSGILGVTEGQWIHPDMCICDVPVGGYKYWMVNSVYPYTQPSTEDAELFVSNNGVDWERIRSVNESGDGGVALRIPQTFFNITGDRANTFMPIPAKGSSFEFARASTTVTTTIKSFLNHDPVICYHNGYVNVYITYNLGLDTTLQTDKYVVCYRTNNGSDWEIVRENGTSMPYNEVNAQLIFTKTGGIRNHVRYMNTAPLSIGGFDACPQIVKVSDSLFYMYYQRTTDGGDLGLIRYTGTSPYTFDFSSYEACALDKPKYGRFWHFCVRFYNGVFYLMYDGNMCSSTDGVNFIQPNFPFFWRGANSDLYKPSFVIGHDGKVKVVQSLQVHLAYPVPFIMDVYPDKIENYRIITQTIAGEYISMSDVISKGSSLKKDAYVDIMLFLSNQRNKNTRIFILPCIRGNYTFEGVDFLKGDEVHVKVFCNTRGDGEVDFKGIIIRG